MTEERITRDDLEKKFRALQADIQGRAQDRKQSIVAAGGAVATVDLAPGETLVIDVQQGRDRRS